MRTRILLAITLMALALSGRAAAPDLLKMVCKGNHISYEISYEKDSKRLFWSSDTVHSEYMVGRTKVEGDGLRVWGSIGPNSYDYLAFFGSKSWIKYFYANGSSQQFACH